MHACIHTYTYVYIDMQIGPLDLLSFLADTNKLPNYEIGNLVYFQLTARTTLPIFSKHHQHNAMSPHSLGLGLRLASSS